MTARAPPRHPAIRANASRLSKVVPTRVEHALQTARSCASMLRAARDLSPKAPVVHAAMAALEELCRARYAEAEAVHIIRTLTAIGELQALRRKLAEAEHADEFFHARRLLQARDAADLPLRLNTVYARMVESEVALIARHMSMAPNDKVVFVGCGALPLTSIYVNHFSGLPVTALDRRLGRMWVGRCVTRRMTTGQVSFRCASGDTFDYKGCNIVFVAGMVLNKRDVFAQIAATNPAALVLTRGGVGLRQLFYAPIALEELAADGWSCLAIAPPPDGVKNTSYLFRRVMV